MTCLVARALRWNQPPYAGHLPSTPPADRRSACIKRPSSATPQPFTHWLVLDFEVSGRPPGWGGWPAGPGSCHGLIQCRCVTHHCRPRVQLRLAHPCPACWQATCQEVNPLDWQFEVIELPIVVVEVATGRTVAEFREHVRPLVNPGLSAFCTQLTGIQQVLRGVLWFSVCCGALCTGVALHSMMPSGPAI